MSTLATSIAVLEGNAKPVRDAVLRGTSVPWFGSGISRERFPGVPSLLEELLTKLHAKSDASDPSCPYRAAATQIVGLAGGVVAVDLSKSPADWARDDRTNLLRLLSDRYASILGMSVIGASVTESVRWDILDLVDKYSNPGVLPDAEHILISVLIAEGLWPDCITTNWDGLIERAAESCDDGNRPSLHVVACNEDTDLATHGNSPRLYKIHGCAIKSKANPSRYKHYMIATAQEIATWVSSEEYAAFRDLMRVTIREKPVLCIGLSAQDFNLQVTLISTTLGRSPFTPTIPRIAFSEMVMTANHQSILQGLYSEDVVNANLAAISREAIIGLYGKPLLAGLYLELLFARAEVILKRSRDLRGVSITLMEQWLVQLKRVLITHFDARIPAIGNDEMWRGFALELPHTISKIVRIYREQEPLATPQTYSPLIASNIAAMELDPNLASLGFHWLLWTGALLCKGHDTGQWHVRVDLATTAQPTPLTLVDSTGSRPVFLVGDAEAGITRLTLNGVLAGDEAIIMYPNGRQPAKATRTPSRSLSVRGMPNPVREVWLKDLYDASSSEEDVINALRLEMI